MALGDAMQKRMEELARRQPMIQRRLVEIAEGATLRAVEAAVEKTPPNTYKEAEIRGVHTITGEMAQRWRKDSQMVAKRDGVTFVTTLENRAGEDITADDDKSYASYVNDGHKVDKHFVPGLYVDDKGLLSYEPSGRDKNGKKVGLVVGTKTKEVEGLYIKEAAMEMYKEVSEKEMSKFAREMFQ